jgi:hypothetical protein
MTENNHQKIEPSTGEKERHQLRMEHLQKYFEPYIPYRWGIFTPITRKRILRKTPLSKRYSSWERFYKEIQEKVKTTLIDLDMFVTLASRKDVDVVLNSTSLVTLVREFFDTREVASLSRLETAEMLARESLDYLTYVSGDYSKYSAGRIEEAKELIEHLVNEARKNLQSK